MTFDNLHSDTGCNCIENAVDDFQGHYIRKINKEELTEKDLATHWERNIGRDKQNCTDVCSHKSVSINQFNEESLPSLINHFITTFNINPKKGCYYVRFRIREAYGKVRPEPLDDNETHYAMFKSDDFNINSLEIVETVKFV